MKSWAKRHEGFLLLLAFIIMFSILIGLIIKERIDYNNRPSVTKTGTILYVDLYQVKGASGGRTLIVFSDNSPLSLHGHHGELIAGIGKKYTIYYQPYTPESYAGFEMLNAGDFVRAEAV